MKIKKPKSEEYLDIYSARLTFTKKKNEQVSKDMVRVVIRYDRKRHIRREDLKVPKDINTFNLNWTKYGGKPIAHITEKVKRTM